MSNKRLNNDSHDYLDTENLTFIAEKKLEVLIEEEEDEYLELSHHSSCGLTIKYRDGKDDAFDLSDIPYNQAIQIRDFLNYCYPKGD